MKKIIYLMIALLFIAGCGNDRKPAGLKDRLCGEWESTSLPMDSRIYMSFTSDGQFELYQKFMGDNYHLYRGSWKLDGNILSGTYNDGEAMAASYEVTINDKILVLTSRNDAADETCFVECSIPDVVKETADVIVKSY